MATATPGKKPAGWRDADRNGLFYEKPGGRRRCKTCCHDSNEGDAPAVSHRPTCENYPGGSRVVFDEAEAGMRRALQGQRMETPIDAELGRYPNTRLMEEDGRLTVVRRQVRPLGKKPPKPVRYEVFLAFVRRKPCRLCGRPAPSDPHHFGPRGVGQKTSDLRLVPLCDSDPRTGYEGHHDYFHRVGCLPGMDRVGTEAWINEAILELHDEFFGAWIATGEAQ